jgi:acyl-CoA thioesterase-2
VATVFEQLMDLRPDGEDRFIAPCAPDRSMRTYGGQFLAHSLRAAQLTVGDDRLVNSTHSYFLRAGDVDTETVLVVERIRDGRSFSQRQVVALQGGNEMFRSLISFHVPEPGLEWAPPVSHDVPEPDEVALTYHDFWETILPPEQRPWPGRARPMDVRYINPPTLPDGEPITEPQLMWMTLREPLGDDQALHDTGLAYLADATLVDHVLLPHGHRWQDQRLTGASLDHAMWFHRPVRADQWLLYDQRVESTGGARGLASGRFYTRDGHLAVTCMQEGLMRWDG